MSEVRKKPITAYKNNKFIGEYPSVKECAKQLELSSSNISAVAKKKSKTHDGYTFEYKEK